MIKRKEFEKLFQPFIEQGKQIWVITRVKELSHLFKEKYDHNLKSHISEKGNEIKEKLRKGKKLKTEDILALQALDE